MGLAAAVGLEPSGMRIKVGGREGIGEWAIKEGIGRLQVQPPSGPGLHQGQSRLPVTSLETQASLHTHTSSPLCGASHSHKVAEWPIAGSGEPSAQVWRVWVPGFGEPESAARGPQAD